MSILLLLSLSWIVQGRLCRRPRLPGSSLSSAWRDSAIAWEVAATAVVGMGLSMHVLLFLLFLPPPLGPLFSVRPCLCSSVDSLAQSSQQQNDPASHSCSTCTLQPLVLSLLGLLPGKTSSGQPVVSVSLLFLPLFFLPSEYSVVSQHACSAVPPLLMAQSPN